VAKFQTMKASEKQKPEMFCCRCLDFLQGKHLPENEGNFGFLKK
jgi:hypothetical protein